MSYIEGTPREKVTLFPESIDDYITPENPVRFIDAFVDHLDLHILGFNRSIPNSTGRPPYNPGDMLKLYVYGYLNGVRTSRKLERESNRNLELMWLIKRLSPDYKTISDFRRDNLQAIKGVFREFTLLCKRLDLFGSELVAIDGSKFKAVNSKKRNYTNKKLKDLVRRIDEKIQTYLQLLDASDDAETEGSELSVSQLEEKIAILTKRKDTFDDMLDELDEGEAKQISLTDPDSRRMQTSGGQDICYNVQNAVDDKHNLIVVHDVINEVTDINQLSSMAKEAKAFLQTDSLKVVGDMGYYNGEEVKECLAFSIEPYIAKPSTSANKKLGLFVKDDFQYVADKDYYICPASEELTFRFDTVEQGRHIRYYRTSACSKCELRSQCTRAKRGGRRITRWVHEDILEEMQERLAAHPEVMQKRKCMVEHPFGTIKRWMDQGYFLMRGLEKVRTEFSLSALVYNMKRVFNIIGVQNMIKALA